MTLAGGRHRVTPAQLALTWLLAQGNDLVPIPGTKLPVRLAEKVAAAEIQLVPDELRRIDVVARGAQSPVRATATSRSSTANVATAVRPLRTRLARSICAAIKNATRGSSIPPEPRGGPTRNAAR